MDLSPVTRTLADGAVVAGLPDARTGTPAQDPPPPVGVAYNGPMGAVERVVLLHDLEVRELIEELLSALKDRIDDLNSLEFPDLLRVPLDIERRVERILARD